MIPIFISFTFLIFCFLLLHMKPRVKLLMKLVQPKIYSAVHRSIIARLAMHSHVVNRWNVPEWWNHFNGNGGFFDCCCCRGLIYTESYSMILPLSSQSNVLVSLAAPLATAEGSGVRAYSDSYRSPKNWGTNTMCVQLVEHVVKLLRVCVRLHAPSMSCNCSHAVWGWARDGGWAVS